MPKYFYQGQRSVKSRDSTSDSTSPEGRWVLVVGSEDWSMKLWNTKGGVDSCIICPPLFSLSVKGLGPRSRPRHVLEGSRYHAKAKMLLKRSVQWTGDYEATTCRIYDIP